MLSSGQNLVSLQIRASNRLFRLIGIAEGDDALHKKFIGQGQSLLDIILGAHAVAVPPISNLDPAGAQAQAASGELQDYGGNGAVLHPDIRLPLDRSHNHSQGRIFQKAAAALFGRGELFQHRFVGDEDKPPGIDAPGRRGAEGGFLELLYLLFFYLPILVSSDAPPISHYVKHSDNSDSAFDCSIR